ncbi:tyrosine-type recombinase/integrase [Rhodoplanes sp. SY1]|uniref:tyrosine-type recombinase/integrase n=1 Tax=Rhodoplanes sp. SY1 TaxID=3166646 RepID=UPI0038B44D22
MNRRETYTRTLRQLTSCDVQGSPSCADLETSEHSLDTSIDASYIIFDAWKLIASIMPQSSAEPHATRSKNGRNWEEALRRLDGAYSENTLRSYRADFRLFDKWCSKQGLCPLPASPETVAAFLAADAASASASTLRRRLASIRKVHRLFHLHNPAEDEDVLIAMRRALRTKPRRPAQALGLTAVLRDCLIAACPENLAGLRDRAVIAVGYDTLCRRSELVALRIEDLSPLPDGGMLALIRRAKNDPFGDGREGFVSAAAAGMLRKWLEAAEITEGDLFRRIVAGVVGPSSLHPHSIGRILKQRARAAGLSEAEQARISGHSMRVGAAQDMMTAGLGILPIMRSGGWKSVNVVARYVQSAEMSKIAALKTRSGSGVFD